MYPMVVMTTVGGRSKLSYIGSSAIRSPHQGTVRRMGSKRIIHMIFHLEVSTARAFYVQRSLFFLSFFIDKWACIDYYYFIQHISDIKRFHGTSPLYVRSISPKQYKTIISWKVIRAWRRFS